MNPEEFDLVNVDPELLETAAAALSSNDTSSSYPPSCDKGGGWEL